MLGNIEAKKMYNIDSLLESPPLSVRLTKDRSLIFHMFIIEIGTLNAHSTSVHEKKRNEALFCYNNYVDVAVTAAAHMQLKWRESVAKWHCSTAAFD